MVTRHLGSWRCIVLMIAPLALVALSPTRASAERVVRIGVVIDGPWERNEPIRQVVEAEIVALAKRDVRVEFPDEFRLVADWTPEGVRAAVDRLLTDPRVDIVLAMGVLASQDVGRRARLAKPVIAPFVINPVAQGFPRRGDASGRKNLSYIAAPWTFERELTVFREVAPFEEVAVLASEAFVKAVPAWRKNIQRTAGSLGVRATVVPVAERARDALDRIPKTAQAVYVGPLLQLPHEEVDRLIRGLIDRRLPSFDALGRVGVERGLLVSIRPDTNFGRLARRLALNVQGIVLGDDPATFPTTLDRGENLVLNMATARAIGLRPSGALLSSAEIVGASGAAGGPTFSMSDAVERALVANQELKAAREDALAADYEVSYARARLLPQIGVSSVARQIDADSARAALGSEPEVLWTGSVVIDQVLWSEPAWSSLTIQKELRSARRHDYRGTELDTVANAAAAYLNVLRARTLERIQQQNLAVTRSNLELARARRSSGKSSRADVLRWEAQIARDRKSVIDAGAQREVAAIAFNRILHRGLEEPFELQDVALNDPILLTSHGTVLSYLRDPWTVAAFREFLVGEALAASPELAGLDARIRAKDRARDTAARSFWSPTLSMRGSIGQKLGEDGLGQNPPALPLPDVQLTGRPDLQWSVALVLSFPLVQGGAGYASLEREDAELRKLRHQREAVREVIEQRVRSAMHVAEAAYTGIALSREASLAAADNLKLVSSAYGEGVVSIPDLLDAQNAALIAEQLAANAVYDFLIDWVRVQRAAGTFEVTMAKEERDSFLARAQRHLAEPKR